MKKRRPSKLVISLVAVGAVLSAAWFFQPSGNRGPVDVKVPRLSKFAVRGQSAFDRTCAACHGRNAAGSDKGPPLVHDIYNPGHHGDASFVFAAKRGVRRHHWNFGNMPPQPQVTGDEMASIIRYVRELQVANGILYRPHRI